MNWFKHILLVVIALPFFANAQILPNLGGQRTGSSALTFLKNDGNTRSLGMASANITLKEDAFTAFTNVANTTSAKSLSIGMSNYFFGAGINQSFLSAILPIQNKNSAFSLTINNLSSGKQEVRTEFQPTGTGEYFYVVNTAVGLGYALKLSDQFSFGVKMKYIHESLAQYQNHTIGADLGFVYNTDIKELSFAVGVSNFGGNSALNGDHQEIKFNQNPTPGPEKFSIPTEFKLGVSMVPLDKNNHKLLTAAQLNHPNDNSENIRLGIEYSYHEMIFGRLGYTLGRKGKKFPSMGLGYRVLIANHPVHINYAFLPASFLGVQHSFGINFRFHKPEERTIENE